MLVASDTRSARRTTSPARQFEPRGSCPTAAGNTSLLRVGRLSSARQVDLASQALCKMQRLRQQRLEAFLVDAAGLESCAASMRMCRQVTVASFSPLLHRHLRAGRLFVPTSNEASADLALYALASGVPLEALSLDRVEMPDAGQATLAPAPGDLFLSVADACH
ncbi:hypothetical protein FZO89_16680 [Luteimonas viscosa]|uniref:Uncharacterized protein n=1 Tax=Luteimonas viscosa TaxID=1132694 RepID=A0A5D4XJ34_9GAMM|nr:hypothetical protein [Luteimonas viscosa]TYT23851.1 hypothetical protein FZO89_16680 [Luteimonas viscosa]